MKEKVLEILSFIKPNVDFSEEKAIIDKGLLESFDILRFVSMLSDEFDVEFSAAELIPENFNSVDAIINIIEELDS